MFYKRLFSVFLAIISLFFFACTPPIPEIDEREIISGFSVHFLNVGDGDCILIKLPDGKTALIDCAEPKEQNAEYIKEFLEDYSVEVIDYFILTHPHTDHIGNALFILENFEVKEIYRSTLSDGALQNFPILGEVESKEIEKKIDLKENNNSTFIKGDVYSFIFLTPYPKSFHESSYVKVNGAEIPEDNDVNDISPIIYFECLNFRFIFTGDAGSSQEKLAIEMPFDPVFASNLTCYGLSVNLFDVDFLKVSHHGADGATCKEFLDVLKPKNAVISVSGENSYGHPNTNVINRLVSSNFECNLYRTDVHGTISVGIEEDKLKIITDKK